jgi:hypothetical protein
MGDDIILAVRATSVSFVDNEMSGHWNSVSALPSNSNSSSATKKKKERLLCILSNLDWRLRNVGLQHRHGTHEIPFSFSPAEERAWP